MKIRAFAILGSIMLIHFSAQAQISETLDVTATIESGIQSVSISTQNMDCRVLRIPTQPGARCVYTPFEFPPLDAFTGNIADPQNGCSHDPYIRTANAVVQGFQTGEIQVTLTVNNAANSSGALVTLLQGEAAPYSFVQNYSQSFTCDWSALNVLREAHPVVVVDHSNTPAANEVIGQVVIEASF